MFRWVSRRAWALAAMTACVVVASCASEPEPPPSPPPPPPPPPSVMLNEGVAQAAAVYIAFLRDVGTIPAGGFQDAESIQAAIRRGAAYEPKQLSRGFIAYGAVLALQSPDYVKGVRTFAVDPAIRQDMIARLVADPSYAATLPGADKAAGLIVDTLGKDSTAMLNIANAVEGDAYTIQERNDPRRRWAIVHITNREERLQSAKALSAVPLLPSAEEASRLLAAGNAGSGLTVSGDAIAGPYTPALNRSLAIAALAALGAGGEEYRANLDYLQTEQTTEFCLEMSKLMLYQCLAASRPSYEDMFCVGRHIARDLATCTSQSLSAGQISIPSEPAVEAAAVQPAVQSEPVAAAPAPAPTPASDTARPSPPGGPN